MSKYAFDTALAGRRSVTLSGAINTLSPFIDLCRHAVERGAFPVDSLAWSASREPLAMSVLYRSVPVWTVIESSGVGQWVVSERGAPVHMPLQAALQSLAHVLASTATTCDGVRFEWRSDGTIGGAF